MIEVADRIAFTHNRPLPDESKASSASSLIKRFQAQISSDESPLLPNGSYGSAGRPRASLPAPAPLVTRLEETRKSLEGPRGPAVGESRNIARPWLKSTSNVSPDATSTAATEKAKRTPSPVPVVTRPSTDVPIPAVASSVVGPSGEVAIAGGLAAKEGLSRPSSPLVETGRLSAPPPSDENSPPPSPIFNSPPPLSAPSLMSAPSSVSTSPPSSSLLLPSPPRRSSARSGSINDPTQAFLLKTKARVSATSSPQPSRTTSPSGSTYTRSRDSSTTSPPLLHPSISPTRKISMTSGVRPRSSSSASNVSTATTGGGAGPRKVVMSTGTPRSRAAAAAALAAANGDPAPPTKKAGMPPKAAVRPKTPVTPSKTPVTPSKSRSTTPSATRTTPTSSRASSVKSPGTTPRTSGTPIAAAKATTPSSISRGKGVAGAAATPTRRPLTANKATTPAFSPATIVPPSPAPVPTSEPAKDEPAVSHPSTSDDGTTDDPHPHSIEPTMSSQDKDIPDIPSDVDEVNKTPRGETFATDVGPKVSAVDTREHDVDASLEKSVEVEEIALGSSEGVVAAE